MKTEHVLLAYAYVSHVTPTSAVRALVNIVCSCDAEVGDGMTNAVQLVSQYLRVRVISRWVIVHTPSLMQAGSINFNLNVKKRTDSTHSYHPVRKGAR